MLAGLETSKDKQQRRRRYSRGRGWGCQDGRRPPATQSRDCTVGTHGPGGRAGARWEQGQGQRLPARTLLASVRERSAPSTECWKHPRLSLPNNQNITPPHSQTSPAPENPGRGEWRTRQRRPGEIREQSKRKPSPPAHRAGRSQILPGTPPPPPAPGAPVWAAAQMQCRVHLPSGPPGSVPAPPAGPFPCAFYLTNT